MIIDRGHYKLISHPIIDHNLKVLRDKNTDSALFRRILSETSRLLAYEVMHDLKVSSVEVETPFETTKVKQIVDDLILVSIMRSGNVMANGILEILPFAKVGHIGIYRDKFIENTVEYYFRLPKNAENKKVILVDPLIATAETAIAAISRLKDYRVGKISFISILSSESGLRKIAHEHPDVDVFTIAVERELNDKGFLLPGLGDAGERLFGTA